MLYDVTGRSVFVTSSWGQFQLPSFFFWDVVSAKWDEKQTFMLKVILE
jgi:hypothetical protein